MEEHKVEKHRIEQLDGNSDSKDGYSEIIRSPGDIEDLEKFGNIVVI